MKKVAVLGCSGSIGKTALSVLENLKEEYQIELLANNEQITDILESKKKFNVKNIFCKKQKYLVNEDREVSFYEGYLADPETYRDIDIVINGIAGIEGLAPSYAVLSAGKILATANKESIVCAGEYLKHNMNPSAKIYPLDSEHSTIWQCVDNPNNVQRIILTASGGAFRDKKIDELRTMKAADALNHPNWNMGRKITIDCASLVNKGLEIIEAKRLFDTEQVDVVLHRESIIHSLVEMKDGAMIAGLSVPDMTIPIQYALTYPNRIKSGVKPLSLTDIGALHFEKIDEGRFPCFDLVKKVSNYGDYAGTVLVAADEIAVQAFLRDEISFLDIYTLLYDTLETFGYTGNIDSVSDAYGIYKNVMEYTINHIKEI